MMNPSLYLSIALACAVGTAPVALAGNLYKHDEVPTSSNSGAVTSTDVHILISHFLRTGYGNLSSEDFARIDPYYTNDNFPIDIQAIITNPCFEIPYSLQEKCFSTYSLQKNFKTILHSDAFKNAFKYTYGFPMNAYDWLMKTVDAVPPRQSTFIAPQGRLGSRQRFARSKEEWRYCVLQNKVTPAAQCYRQRLRQILSFELMQ